MPAVRLIAVAQESEMTDDRRDVEKLKPSPDEAPGSAGAKAGDMGEGSFEESHEGEDKGAAAAGRPGR